MNRRARRAIARNWRHVLGPDVPDAVIDDGVRTTFANLGRYYYELFRLPALSAENVAGAVEIRGWEHVETARGLGKGVVLTSIHGCGAELVLSAMSLRGVPITIPVERIEPPQLYRFISHLRACRGLTLVPADGSMVCLRRALRRGEVVGVAADKDVTGSGSPTTFFGAPAGLPRGHVRLAARAGAPLVFCSFRRTGFGTFVAAFSPHVTFSGAGDHDRDFAGAVKYIVSEMETTIRACPEQWLMTTDVWGDLSTGDLRHLA